MNIEKITWIDSRGVGSNWDFIENIKNETCHCVSVGVVIGEDHQAITVAPHIVFKPDSSELEQVCGEMSIPKTAIIERIFLEKSE